MGLFKTANLVYGMPQEHKELVRLMKIPAGSKKKAVQFLEKALEMRKNGHGDKEVAFFIRKIAEENAYKPNFGERLWGMTHERMVSELETYLLRVEPIKEAPRK